jgi:recombination protein RecR
MPYHVKLVSELTEELSRMPGIGPRTAQRLAFYVLRIPMEDAKRLSDAIVQVKERINYCSVCNNITEEDPCRVCKDPGRNRSIICVVEEPHDVVALEKAGGYRGLYHVLMGVLSPLGGVGPKDLKIDGLMARLKEGETSEVIMATNPSAEGEATAMYLAKLIRPLGIKLTRIACGLPVGGDLEYADQATLARAIAERRRV